MNLNKVVKAIVGKDNDKTEMFFFASIAMYSDTPFACKRERSSEHLFHEDPLSERKINENVTIIGTPITVTSINDTISVGQVLVDTNLPKGTPSQILNRIGYTTSYNCNTKCPNWVAWHSYRIPPVVLLFPESLHSES